MLSQIPLNLRKKAHLDKEIIRIGIIAELDAINLYEQLASLTKNENIKRILLDIAKEEETHVGQFYALLLKEGMQRVRELEEGKEVQAVQERLQLVSKRASRAAEEKAIRAALSTCQGNKTRTAEVLGVSYKTLLTKIKEYVIM